MKNVLNLPEELKERREVLENELKEVVTQIIFESLQKDLTELFDEYGVEISKIEWDFNGEYDDEGGTDWYPSDFCIYDKQGRTIYFDDLDEEVTTSYGSVYEKGDLLRDGLCDILGNFHEELYEYYITEFEMKGE